MGEHDEDDFEDASKFGDVEQQGTVLDAIEYGFEPDFSQCYIFM